MIATTYTTKYSGGVDINDIPEPASETSFTTEQRIDIPWQKEGSDTPGWEAAIRAGLIVSNTYDMYDGHMKAVPIQAKAKFWRNPYWQQHGTYEYSISGHLPLDISPTFPGLTSGQSENQAKSIFVSRASSQVSSLQGGVLLGELRETLHLIRSPAQGIRKLLGDFNYRLNTHRGRHRTPKQKNQYLTDQWLETAFGIKPLIADTKNAAEALARLVNGSHPPAPIKAYGNDMDMLIDSQGSELTNGPLRATYALRVMDDWRTVAWGAVNTDAVSGTLDILGLNIDNFIPTIWELIPYSFVVDYFSNVGQVLQAASFCTSRLKYWGLSSKATRQYFAFINGDNTDKSDPAYISSSVGGGNTLANTVRFGRVPGGSLVPDFTLKVPGLGQLVNLTALLNGFRGITPY